MMPEMVERWPGDPIGEMAGRAQFALIEKFGPTGTWDRFMLGEFARTVIAAMRDDPPVAMVVDGFEAMTGDWQMCRDAAEDAERCWRAMIDRALK